MTTPCPAVVLAVLLILSSCSRYSEARSLSQLAWDGRASQQHIVDGSGTTAELLGNLASTEQRSFSRHLAQSNALFTCLSGINGLTVLGQSASNFNTARSVWNTRALTIPTVITYPRSADDVSKIVNCAQRNGQQAVVRSGGHSYEGYGVQQNKVVVDMSKMTQMSMLPGGTRAKVQPGVRLGPLHNFLWQNGKRSVPAGTCPTVGVGGHVLGGGFGMLSRRFGLLADRLEAAQMVLANGTIITVDATHNPDLLWACKGGGGGNFGIVTSYTLSTAVVPDQVTVIDIEWPSTAAAAAMRWFQSKMPTMPQELTTDLFMGYGVVQMHGLYLGMPAQARSLLNAAGINSIGSPNKNNYNQMSFIDAVLEFGMQSERLKPQQQNSLNLGPGVHFDSPTPFKAKSNFVTQPMSDAGINTMISQLATAKSSNINGWAQWVSYGGRINQVGPTATAFPHRHCIASIQFYVSWSEPSQAPRSQQWIQGFWNAMRPYVDSAAYINYIDKDLGTSSMQDYYGANLARLVSIKQQYDGSSGSNGFFNYPFSIPTGLSVAADSTTSG